MAKPVHSAPGKILKSLRPLVTAILSDLAVAGEMGQQEHCPALVRALMALPSFLAVSNRADTTKTHHLLQTLMDTPTHQLFTHMQSLPQFHPLPPPQTLPTANPNSIPTIPQGIVNNPLGAPIDSILGLPANSLHPLQLSQFRENPPPESPSDPSQTLTHSPTPVAVPNLTPIITDDDNDGAAEPNADSEQNPLQGDASAAALAAVVPGVDEPAVVLDDATGLMVANTASQGAVAVAVADAPVVAEEQPGAPTPAAPARENEDTRLPRPVVNEKKIRTLLKHNCAGKATSVIRQVIASAGVAPINTNTAATIQRLFPEARANGDTLPQHPRACPVDARIELTADDIVLGLQDLPKQSAAGLSGWTYDLVRELGVGSAAGGAETTAGAAASAEVVEFRTAVRRVFNCLLRGAYSNSVDWTGDRVIPLIKKDGGIRPIVIGEAWIRILSRIVAKKLRSRAAELLSSCQYGVGVPGGAEIIAHVVHMGERMLEADNATLDDPDQRWGIQTIDFKNAFNSIHRGAIYHQLEEHLPGLVPLFRFIYARPSNIYFNDGSRAAVCGTGVKQGDPLGPLYFSLALQPVLVTLSQQVLNPPGGGPPPPNVPNHIHFHNFNHANNPTALYRAILAYLDDVTLLAPRYLLRRAVTFLRARAGRIGLELNVRKSVLWQPDLPPPALPEAQGVRVDDDGALTGTAYTHQGIATLGTAIGTPTFHRLTAVAEIHKVKGELEAIAALSPDLMLPLIQSTINTVPMYLARTSLPEDTDLALQDFDAAVDAALLKACGSSAREAPQALQMVRGLPARDGGLSIPRLHLIRNTAFVASFLAANAQLTSLNRPLVTRLHAHSANLEPILAVVHQLCPHLTSMTTNLADGSEVRTLSYWQPTGAGEDRDNVAPEAPKQKELLKTLYLAQRGALRAHLTEIGDRPGLAFWRSCCFGSSTSPFYLANVHFHSLTPAAFQTALAMRLLIRKQLPPGQQFLCSACHAIETGATNALDPLFHCLSCPSCQGIRTNRHNSVRDVLQQLLVRLFGANNVAVEEGQQPGLRRSDITLQHNAGYTLFDVSVVSPTTARALAHHSCDTQDAAAKMIEDEKRHSWSETLIARQLAPSALIPFVLESSGRFGPAALKFLKELASFPSLRPEISAAPTISFFKKQMQERIFSANHQAIVACGSASGPIVNA